MRQSNKDYALRAYKREVKQMNKKTLLASAPTLDGIINMCMKYFYADTVQLLPIGENVWEVATGKGKKPGFLVIQKKNRFRFELE
jgi:hypothetical protein